MANLRTSRFSNNKPAQKFFQKLGRSWKRIAFVAFNLLLFFMIFNLEPLSNKLENSNKSKDTEISPSNLKDQLLLVNTPTCKIPLTHLWPSYYKDDWDFSSDARRVPQCERYEKLFSYETLDKEIKVTYPNLTECNLRELINIHDDDPDKEFKEVNRIDLDSGSGIIDVSELEAFMVECNGSYQFEANIPDLRDVQAKIKYWKNKMRKKNKNKGLGTQIAKATQKKPISVLWLGLDSQSRMHVHRSWSKTVGLLNRMAFIDFQGHHSVMPKTLPNWLAFLAGLRGDEVEDCRQDWQDPFDACHLIWREFNLRNYITMHIEDSVGTFNWGYGGGFENKPVDYYPHPCQLATRFYRTNQPGKERFCTSSETIAQFMLRYNERFLQKFNSTPFFSFTWFNDPFHDYEFGLPNADEDFFQFFKNLEKDREFLENTIIVLHADHGFRFGFYQSDSVQGFLERSMVPLFIRIPENLLLNFPHLNLKEFAQTNTQLLTTPFDLHHTMLHVLNLNDELMEGRPPNSFQPVLPDRSSLLAFVPDNRTCDSVNIAKWVCTCNMQSSGHSIDNMFLISRMIEHSIEELNQIVKDSKYNGRCEEWLWGAPDSESKNGNKTALISADILEQSENVSIVLLKFRTEPLAVFEVHLRLTNLQYHGENEHEEVLISTETGLGRIDMYGNTSWCVDSETLADKQMKEFCYCL